MALAGGSQSQGVKRVSAQAALDAILTDDGSDIASDQFDNEEVRHICDVHAAADGGLEEEEDNVSDDNAPARREQGYIPPAATIVVCTRRWTVVHFHNMLDVTGVNCVSIYNINYPDWTPIPMAKRRR